MSDITIKQLAQDLGLPVDKLLGQLDAAGMKFRDPEQFITSTDRIKLLGHLRRSHGKDHDAVPEASAPRQITLKRSSTMSIKVPSAGGRGAAASGAKTVNVEVRSKKTYIKRSEIADKVDVEREEARRKLEASPLLREQEEQQRRLQAERQQREAAVREQQRLQTEAEALRQQQEASATEAERLGQETEVAECAAAHTAEQAAEALAVKAERAAQTAMAEPRSHAEKPEKTERHVKAPDHARSARRDASTPVSRPPVAVAESTVAAVNDEAQVQVQQRIDQRSLGLILPQIHERRREKKVAPPPAPAPVAAKPAAKPAVKPVASADAARGKGRHEREKADASTRGKRFAAGELHLTDVERARRSKKGRSGRGASQSSGRETARQASNVASQHGFSRPTAPVVREVVVGDANVVADLAQKMAVKGAEVVKALFKMGVMATINQTIDRDTATLVVEELGHKVLEGSEQNAEAALAAHTQTVELEGEKTQRPPVVTIMGHVDHGKTSLLDYIRRTRVAAGEAGGITQHIGAYHVDTHKGVITFLDTPGHAAFTAMRARGAQATDIVVLVVAADDGVMPQTAEAVRHARAAKVPLIVAMNKMDKSDANPDHVKQELGNLEVIPEDWGGDTQFVPVSAKTGMGIDALLDAISVQAEIMELRAVAEGAASGVVIESRLDKGRGPVATVLVQQGTLQRGDFVVCGIEYGRMRALIDETGKTVLEAGPSIPVQVLGLSGVPEAGDDFVVVADEKLAKEVAVERLHKRRETRLVGKANRLEDIMAQMGQGEAQQVLNILVKADVQGSVEALRESLSAIGNEQVKVNVVAAGVGGITESDATLASASKALLIGFNVRADASARKVIETHGLDVRYYSIIYDVIDQVKQAASGLLGMEIREEIVGTAQVREVFRSSKFGAVAGCMVVEGVVKRHKPVRVLRNNTVIFQGELESLRRFKDIVDEVRNGMECGIAVKQYNDVKPGDQIECYERIEVARSL